MEEIKTQIEMSQGNVYADLGYSESEEMMAKAQLVRAISIAIKSKGLSQTEAAELMGLDQPKVSKLLRGQFRGFSADRLLHILNLLGQDVVITILASPQTEARTGHISVAMTGGF